MNAARRKDIDVQIEVANGIKDLEFDKGPIVASLDNLRDGIDAILDEEQAYFDNMPESFQNGDKGEQATASISALEDAINDIDGIDLDDDDESDEDKSATVVDALDNCVSNLEQAKE